MRLVLLAIFLGLSPTFGSYQEFKEFNFNPVQKYKIIRTTHVGPWIDYIMSFLIDITHHYIEIKSMGRYTNLGFYSNKFKSGEEHYDKNAHSLMRAPDAFFM